MNENTHHLEPDMQNQRRDIESIQLPAHPGTGRQAHPFPECRRPVRAGNRSVRKGVSAYIRSAGYRKASISPPGRRWPTPIRPSSFDTPPPCRSLSSPDAVLGDTGTPYTLYS